MKVALLGATGFVGSALLNEALNRCHTVIAIVRHPEKLEKRAGLTAKVGDVYDTASLAALIRSNHAVISAFNPGWKDPNLYDDQVRGTTSIIDAIKMRGSNGFSGWVGRWAAGQARSSCHRQSGHATLGEAWLFGDHECSGSTTERAGT